MSKIGNAPVTIEATTQVEINPDLVKVTGKEGSVSIAIPFGISVAKDGEQIIVKRSSESKKVKALHGLIRSLINNAVIGVSKKWEKDLEVFGTGYRVKAQGEDLLFEVGYSHTVTFKKAEGVHFTVEGNNKVKIDGVDKQKVGEIAYKIRSIKKPDAYKGKGIRYKGEVLRLKPGKKAKAA
jgi:large subunit ribosomal protein L6